MDQVLSVSVSWVVLWQLGHTDWDRSVIRGYGMKDHVTFTQTREQIPQSAFGPSIFYLILISLIILCIGPVKRHHYSILYVISYC